MQVLLFRIELIAKLSYVSQPQFLRCRSFLNNLNFCVRSIGSESSVSLSSDTNFPSPSALRRINEGPSQPQVTASAAHQPPPQTASNSPKQAKKTAIQSRLASPKRSPKLQRGEFSLILKIECLKM